MRQPKRRRWVRTVALTAMAAFALSGCGPSSCGLTGDDGRVLLRSDPPMAGYTGSLSYTINGVPGSPSEKNDITFRGVNGNSPMPLLDTTFGKGAGTTTQTAQVTADNGTVINALGMNKWNVNVGLTDYLSAQVATYEQRDVKGNRVCGAKVRLDFKPNIAQIVKKDKYRRAWDALFYYSVPCTSATSVPTTAPKSKPATDTIARQNAPLDLDKAKLLALVIDQQTAPRVTGKPIFFNRGHSVTIVGGRAANYVGGWWEAPAGLLNASNMIIGMVKDLDNHDWLSFGDVSNGGLVYSAGDADVYLSLKRIFLGRQSSYLVNFRSTPNEPWRRVRVDPKYNIEWNDFSQNYKALTGKKMPSIDSMVDQNTGLPKDINDPDSDNSKTLKEIETAGCQNCSNPTLEQIQLVDETEGSPTAGQPLYAMTIRGWLGSQRTLVMFGNLPTLNGQPVTATNKPATPDSFNSLAEQHRKDIGMTECPVQRNEKGEKLDSAHQYPTDKKDQGEEWSCTRMLREGALWDLLTHDASKFGFDVVGQFSVRDNSSYSSHCSGSGESTSCTLKVDRYQLDSSYMFTDVGAKLQKAWTIMQLLGEVGMRTLGMSYASGQYDGSGLDFAMAQPQVYNSYYSDMGSTKQPYNIERLFSLDARALQLPQTLGEAAQDIGLN